MAPSGCDATLGIIVLFNRVPSRPFRCTTNSFNININTRVMLPSDPCVSQFDLHTVHRVVVEMKKSAAR